MLTDTKRTDSKKSLYLGTYGKRPIFTVFENGSMRYKDKQKWLRYIAKQWGSINAQETVLTPNKDDMLAVWFDCSGHGGYIVITDKRLDYGFVEWSSEFYSYMNPEWEFYIYRFEEDVDFMVFEMYEYDRLCESVRRRYKRSCYDRDDDFIWMGRIKIPKEFWTMNKDDNVFENFKLYFYNIIRKRLETNKYIKEMIESGKIHNYILERFT